jgi:hypothetical protein
MTTRTRWGLLCATATLVLGLAVSAQAQNAHFVGKVTATLQGTDVQVCWKEAGLGDNALIDYVASADATATYVCVNHGGQCPNAANKITVFGPVTASGTFASGKNGNITACLVIEPPGPGTFTCPGGQTRTLAEVGYTNVSIEDVTNGVEQDAVPVNVSATPFVCPGP